MKDNNLKEYYKTHRYILAPMAGVNDVAFRQLCIEGGADLTYTEMISSMGLRFANHKTRDMLALADSEKQVVVQLFGHDPHTLSKQAADVEKDLSDKLSYIDINMGCPAPKIVKKGDGASLMKQPELAAKIVSECKQACSCPITVKFRRGYNIGEESALYFAKLLQDAGADGVCVHGRYAQQYYRGEADWEIVGKIAEELEIPVVGSGDIVDAQTASNGFGHGVDAVMIGRAARGNPFIFDICKGSRPDVKAAEIIQTGKRHLQLFSELSPKLLKHMRKHCI